MDIVFSQVSKAFHTVNVLEKFSYCFSGKSRYCLMGPSGCGKTTLLNLAAGLLRPDSGKIDTGEAKISYAFQEDRLLPWVTAAQNIALVSSMDEAKNWLARMEMSSFAEAFPEELSGGMKQRISVARALAAKSDVFLFDEPFQGLDMRSKEILKDTIKEATCGKLCIFVVHGKEDAYSVADNVLSFSGPPLVLEKES